ncbi:CobN/magnesium chelatase [Dunaliella salina]|uniref:CobN/magnesium chelatase n=1 Tax=Dunaliella salina TaxID=3046 RepID=A0ABQ7H9N5_DUNSA|nr:CobN/magnesium chelatase [Dunaliella salina]|eukprot:KAF5843565.1 CobN/magnesium chelatase [Dunaliella salina]
MYPPDWGPSEWGPIPFLPDNDVLVKRMQKQWGDLSSYRGIMSSASGQLVVPGLRAGNVYIGVQPLLGLEGDPMRLLFERDLTPHPQYAAFYKWLQHENKTDVVLHFGMHGTVEWLPGSPLGNNGLSWSDVLMGDLPNVYVYAANNPSESIIAKRRGYGTIVSHNVPPYGRAGLYKQLATLRDFIQEWREGSAPMAAADHASSNSSSAEMMGAAAQASAMGAGSAATSAASAASNGVGSDSRSSEGLGDVRSSLVAPIIENIRLAGLQVLENRLFSEGLHVLGTPPTRSQLSAYLNAYFDGSLPQDALDAVADAEGLATARARLERSFKMQQPEASTNGSSPPVDAGGGLLAQNSQELTGVLRALRGEYVLPEAGGDLLRDGVGVLPTGRNIHALDPYRMPSPAAAARGSQAAQAILDSHTAANQGTFPETVSVNLWGLDAIKTKGESVGMVLHFVGGRPVKEGTGRIARFELIPLEEMGGLPRVDVLYTEYYANTGALQKAAASARGGKAPGVSIVEAFGKEVKPRELKDVLRIEYRTKLLNPRWAEAMSAQGSGGAFEISQRMTAMVGWGATSDFRENWAWDQAAETYALDEAMAEKLRQANPQAFSNVLRRMLEASGRGMWDASPEVLNRLRALYSDMDDQLEGVKA